MRYLLLCLPVLLLAAEVRADEPLQFDLTLRDHRFDPNELHLPAGRPTVLVLHNADPTAEEFESTALKVEKLVPGGGTVTVRLRPLGPGRFPFFGEYHAETAQGVLIAEDQP